MSGFRDDQGVARLLATIAVFAAFLGGCATVPAGGAGVASTPGGESYPLGEGVHLISPFTSLQIYDFRQLQVSEELFALAADGAEVRAGDSLVTFHIVGDSLVALNREIGPDYYNVLVRPTIQAAVRRVFAGIPSDRLDAAQIRRAQEEITQIGAATLRRHGLILEAVLLRNVVNVMPRFQRAVLAGGVAEQSVLASKQRTLVSEKRADEQRQMAVGVATAHQAVAPTLTPEALEDGLQRAWFSLLTASGTTVEVTSQSGAFPLEVDP